MKEDYSSLCWNCHKKTMQPAKKLPKGWYQCSECGATWTKPLKVKASSVTMQPDTMLGKGRRSRSPRVLKRKGE